MYVKIVESKIKRKPTPSGVFRTLEYRQVRASMYGGNWHADGEVQRSCRQKWILQAVNSRRVDGRVVKTSRHVLTMNFYGVVDTLCDINPDRHLEAFMETPYVKSAMLRSFGTADCSNADVQKARAAVADIVTKVMDTYNESEEAVVRKDNVAKRLEVAQKITMEEQAYSESKRLLEIRELALEEDIRPIRETAMVLADRFFRQAVLEYHPDHTNGVAAAEVANEKMIALLAVKAETFKVIKTIKQLPQPEDCQDDDIPF